MFCPQCGQQKISKNSRFCSRCGLPIDGIVEWIARGGMMPVMQAPQPFKKPNTPKRKGMSRGAKLMFISCVLFPLFFGLAVAADSPGPLVVPITVFFAGLSVLLYSVFFGDETPIATAPPQHQPGRLAGMFGNSALPPAPAQVHMNTPTGQQVRTSELVGPPSVTENTTKLLDRE